MKSLYIMKLTTNFSPVLKMVFVSCPFYLIAQHVIFSLFCTHACVCLEICNCMANIKLANIDAVTSFFHSAAAKRLCKFVTMKLWSGKHHLQ